MTLDKFIRWTLFCAGIITAIFAGYMFYIDNIAGGAAWLAVSVGFLCFATRIRQDGRTETSQTDSTDDNDDLHNMAVIISDVALASLRNIGRTIPPSEKEIAELEEKLNRFLDAMPVDDDEREEIADEFERLRERTRRTQSGRAIMRRL